MTDAIKQSQMYKQQYFSFATDTSYVESFNNHLNIWHDKRINFGKEQFRMRSELAVLSWNENVDREYTSIWSSRNCAANKRKSSKKRYKRETYQFRDKIWNNYMSDQFGKRAKFTA